MYHYSDFTSLALRTFVSVANVRDPVSLLSGRENGRYKWLLLQATQWKLVGIILKIEFIVPGFPNFKSAIVWGCEILERGCVRVSGPCPKHAR